MTNNMQKFGQIEKKNFSQDAKEQFDALRISIASPDIIINEWSHGEVTKPETINYHSLKPEEGGLFCQKIFGPVKDYECICGKYKGKKQGKNTTCTCGVDIVPSSVRRTRMGHIKLAIHVAHTWFLREGKIATLLNNLPQKKLEQVIAYDAYIVIEPGLTDMKQYDILSTDDYLMAIDKYGSDAFTVGIGAEGIYKILADMNLDDERKRLQEDLDKTKSESKRKSIVKQLKLVEAFLESKVKPEWMLPDVLPVTPPDMRPLVTLDAGHVAASDLNDLYRRVIIRNNRLKKFIGMHAPDIIVRNEKRMLQEAVDSLFDNGHKARPMVSQNRRPLKSLSDSLRGKNGRFRMNMLGKRVDYSGRSVIIPGPFLRMHQVGLPKTMALELFKPFVYAKLMASECIDPNNPNNKGKITLKTARKMVEAGDDRVWDILEEVIYQHPVLLNRAPSLHRLSLIAFEPVLIEGKAIRLHPLVCKGFNADFDGDQMSVHVPISLEAQIEARTLMLSTNNVLSPASGEPMTVPTQDMVLGVYYLSLINGEHDKEKSPKFSGMDEVEMALENKTINLHTPIYARIKGKTYATTAGRMILGGLLPDSDEMPFDLVNKVIPAGEIKSLLSMAYERCGDKAMILLADALKDTGFEYGARSGISIGFDDIVIPEEKKKLVGDSEKETQEIEKQFQNGLLSAGERHNKLVDLWQRTTDKLGKLSFETLKKQSTGRNWNSIYMMADSKARGSEAQIRQVAGMRGLMMKPDGSIIEVPITSNFKEGLTMSEYFISTHGARKGMSDTALKTAEAGYLTRRMVDLGINAVITEHDCGTTDFIEVDTDKSFGRTVAKDVKDADNNVILSAGELVTKAKLKEIKSAGVAKLAVRSVLTCHSDGICAKCYGMDLSRNTLVNVGEPVGLIAGQSVGEPGTQLTLRTFHTGGAASGVVSTAVLLRNDNIKRKDNIGVSLVALEKGKDISDYDTVIGEKIVFTDKEANTLKSRTFEIINPFDKSAKVSITEHTGSWKEIVLTAGKETVTYIVPKEAEIQCLNGAEINPFATVYKLPMKDTKAADITGGLPRVNDLLESRHPVKPAVLAETDGRVYIERGKDDKFVSVHLIQNDATDADAFIGKIPAMFDNAETKGETSSTTWDNFSAAFGDASDIEYNRINPNDLIIHNGQYVTKGQALTKGEKDQRDILRIQGQKELSTYMVQQLQGVYAVQGVTINDKHIEILVREMTRRVEVIDSGDTKFLNGMIVDKVDFDMENEAVKKANGKIATASPTVVGLTRASLTSRSFISNASFQQTTKVLVDAAIKGEVDHLRGVNENLIVGRLIPVGTGAYVHHARAIAKAEEEAEKLANQANNKQIEMNM